MEKLTWFKFSPSDWMMGMIQLASEQSQLRFIKVCCLYWNHEGELSTDEAKLHLGEDSFKELLKLKIIKTNKKKLVIKFLDSQLDSVDNMREQRSKAGKRSAEIRKAKAKQKPTKSNTCSTSDEQNSTEKRRGEESREEYNIFKEEFFTAFNNLKTFNRGRKSTHKSLSKTDEANLKKLILKGFDINDFQASILNMLKADWPKQNNQDNPAHLLREDNFIKYLEQGDQTKVISPASDEYSSNVYAKRLANLKTQTNDTK